MIYTVFKFGYRILKKMYGHCVLINLYKSLSRALYKHIIGPQRVKNCLWGFANNTGADQPAHPRSLISAFVIRYLESIVVKLAPYKIPLF